MAVLLSIVPETLGPRPVSSAKATSPAVGGVRQRKVRLGSHFRMEGKFPPLDMALGRSHVADLLDCETTPAALLIPQPELVVGNPGGTLVKGAGQSGANLILDTATAGYTFQKGQFFNVITATRRYLHTVQADVTADGGGNATIRIWPLLRVIPADNSQLDFLNPRIEGWLEFGGGWDITPDFTVETSFSIEEAA